jgi:hypothetical protein
MESHPDFIRVAFVFIVRNRIPSLTPATVKPNGNTKSVSGLSGYKKGIHRDVQFAGAEGFTKSKHKGRRQLEGTPGIKSFEGRRRI